MKKIIVVILAILFLSGCNIDVNYVFHENTIDSKVTSSFTLQEFYDNSDYEKIDNADDKYIYNLLSKEIETDNLQAFTTTDKYNFERKSFTKSGNVYNLEYGYTYGYKNFYDNYILKNCFDKFEFTEDETYYNIHVTGKYKCDGEITLKFSSDNGIENSNSVDIKNGVHSFYVFDEDNDIKLSIRKEKYNEVTNYSTLRVIGLIIIIICSIVTYIFINKINNSR